MSEPATPVRSPFTIGVSGHRDIHPDCIELLRVEVARIIDYLSGLAPNTDIRVMVGMAEGADLLVAQTALERHLAIDAALPMPLEQYSADFGADSLALLKDLLARPQVQCIDLSPPVRGGADDDLEHHSLYVNLTGSLIRKSNLLIALWDGESSALPGGTADTVLKYLGARTSADSAHDISFVEEQGDTTLGYQFVYWIPARRKKGAAAAGPLPEPCYLSAIDDRHLRCHREMPAEIRHQLLELDGYNRQYDELRTSGKLPPRDTLMGVVPEGTPAEERALLRRIDAEYSKADALAVFYQRYSDRLFKWFSLMAAAMGVLFLTYTELFSNELFLVAYLAVLLLGLLTFYSVRGRHWFSRHLVYRVLAETMRTKFFLHMASADSQVNAAELIRLTGIDRFTGFSWITNILKNVEPFSEAQAAQYTPAPEALNATERAWIDNQERYYTTKVLRLGRTHHRLGRMKGSLFLVLAIIAITVVTWSHELHEVHLVGHVPLAEFLMFLMGLLPVWIGIWEIYQNKMATRELLWQYRNQLGHFSRARSQLARVATPERQIAILADLGRRSLFESYLWTIHRFHREHEPPAVG